MAANKCAFLLLGLCLVSNWAFSEELSVKDFKVGTYHGITHSKKKCTVIIEKKRSLDEILHVTIVTTNHKGQKIESIMNFSKNDELQFEGNRDSGQFGAEILDLTLSKSKVIPEPNQEEESEYNLTLVESFTQEITNKKLTKVQMQWLEINEHSDPHDDSIFCIINK